MMRKFVIVILLGLVGCVYFYVNSAPFGKLPQGERMERISESPNYRNGIFQNQQYTPVVIKSKDSASAWVDFLLPNQKDLKPSSPLPVIETDLKNLDPKENILVWFGHSSYFIQLAGKRILIDPLFSEVSSPIPFFPRSFKCSIHTM